MIKVGLTGNFHSGQNLITTLFEKNDIAVFDADLILKYLINYSKPHINLIKSKIGEKSFSMGLLNINYFRSTKDWDNLIDLVEFDIIKAYENFRLKHQYDVFTIFKYSYLFERNLNNTMDYNISCYKPKNLRIEEIKKNTIFDSPTIAKVIKNEMDELYKNNKSDFIIDTFNRHTDFDTQKSLEGRVISIIDNIHKKIPQSKESTLGNNYISGFWD